MSSKSDEYDYDAWIITDLDNTLCQCDHRISYAKERQWDEFHSRLSEDGVYDDVANTLMNINESIGILVVSGRNEAYRQQTFDWLDKNDISVDEVLLRPNGDWRPDHDLKPQLILEFFGSEENAKDKIITILDDREKVIAAFREKGWPCWSVRGEKY